MTKQNYDVLFWNDILNELKQVASLDNPIPYIDDI